MAAQNRDEVMMAVLHRLAQHTQYSNPVPTSDIKHWFAKVNKHDTATGLPVKRTNLFVFYTLQDVGGSATLSPAELIGSDLAGGRYATVNDLVDHLDATR